MYRGECLNAQLLRVIGEAGHTDTLCVTDAGFPVPDSTERVDLAWRKGSPGWIEICRLLKEELIIEKIILAEEIKTKNPEMLKDFTLLFPETPIMYITHEKLKEMSREAKAVIRTGECTSFSNCIFVAGVAF